MTCVLLLRQNEQLRKALRKITEAYEVLCGTCFFCGDDNAHKHIDDCEYVKLTKEVK
jgi:hypothetical protein